MRTASLVIGAAAVLPLVPAGATEKAAGDEGAGSRPSLFDQYQYEPKEIAPNVAAGGLGKLVDRGVFRRREQKAKSKNNSDETSQEERKLKLRTGAREAQTTMDTTRAQHGSGGGWSPQYDDHYYYDSYDDYPIYHDPGYRDDFYPSGGAVDDLFVDDALIDDSLGAEEVLFLSAFQDTRFTSSEPIFVTPNNPDPLSTGNLWVYADLPLQAEFGIDVDPLLGIVHGTCESTFENLNGFCSFTYEFFDGGPEVIASMTVSGATEPFGPSILTVSGGTGELAGVSGEVSLSPVSLDTAFVPPVLATDDSTLFLGSPIGYYMEAVIYIRFRVADIVDDIFLDDVFFFDDVVVEEEVDVVVSSPVRSYWDGTVQCPEQLSVCDCDLNCVDGSTYCDCMDGVDCCTSPQG